MRPDSPCIGVCTTVYTDECLACGRTYMEVARWTEMSDEEKEAVWERIERERTAWRYNRYKDRAENK